MSVYFTKEIGCRDRKAKIKEKSRGHKKSTSTQGVDFNAGEEEGEKHLVNGIMYRERKYHMSHIVKKEETSHTNNERKLGKENL